MSPLECAADAQRLSQEGRTRGKIVVTVDWEPDEGAVWAGDDERALYSTSQEGTF